MLPQDEEQRRYTAHTRSEERRNRGIDNVAAEVEKLLTKFATGVRMALRALMGFGFAFAA
jgi:hypothetical protein